MLNAHIVSVKICHVITALNARAHPTQTHLVVPLDDADKECERLGVDDEEEEADSVKDTEADIVADVVVEELPVVVAEGEIVAVVDTVDDATMPSIVTAN